MKKILLLLLIVAVGYGILVFAMPDTAKKIDEIIGLPGFSEQIIDTKTNIDSAITDIPSVEEFKSGALDIKNTFTDGVSTTKETIDSIRDGAQKVESTYNEAKDTFEDAKEVFEDATEKVNDLKGVVDSVSKLTESE